MEKKIQSQDMLNSAVLNYTRQREASLEAEVLRPENKHEIQSMNRQLKTELDLLIQNHFDFHLSIGGIYHADEVENQNLANRDDVSDESPTIVIEIGDHNRFSPPKSISVRSSPRSGGVARCGGTMTKPKPCGPGQLSTTQRRGGKKEEKEEIGVEVYNHRMTKTQLCYKWEETGTCPYGDHCQFAHGIKELRPSDSLSALQDSGLQNGSCW